MANLSHPQSLVTIIRTHAEISRLAAQEGPGAADVDLLELVNAVDLEALYQRTLLFWASSSLPAAIANRTYAGVTTREAWLDWINEGQVSR